MPLGIGMWLWGRVPYKVYLNNNPRLTVTQFMTSKKGGKDQESIQSSTTPDPEYHMGK